ncbi:hypothetical protein C2E23DRAFT_426837 [Lenzites betulinus]|nr:hypothetical protein C2E23DRAFT_426837 [Lenzites betulinus]
MMVWMRSTAGVSIAHTLAHLNLVPVCATLPGLIAFRTPWQSVPDLRTLTPSRTTKGRTRRSRRGTPTLSTLWKAYRPCLRPSVSAVSGPTVGGEVLSTRMCTYLCGSSTSLRLLEGWSYPCPEQRLFYATRDGALRSTPARWEWQGAQRTAQETSAGIV